MNQNALEVKDLTKKYKDFALDNVSFAVPRGSIVGLIGENGAGKSTILNAITGVIKKDEGIISVLGREGEDIDNGIREKIGVVFDGSHFPKNLTAAQINTVLKNIYTSWDEKTYFQLLDKMNLPLNKKVQQLSKGMKMKLSIAVTLSHQSDLLILDEVTSGLDPIVRDDILDLFLEFVQDENHSILVSSHITSDLEKVADYIVFVHKGKVVFSKSKDELIYKYGIIKCGAALFETIDKKDMIAYRKQDYEWQVLTSNKEAAQRKYPKAVVDGATIDEIMLLYIKGESR